MNLSKYENIKIKNPIFNPREFKCTFCQFLPKYKIGEYYVCRRHIGSVLDIIFKRTVKKPMHIEVTRLVK